MTLGEKLKDIRKRFDLSQEELAEIMNVSRNIKQIYYKVCFFDIIKSIKLKVGWFHG